MAIRVAKLDNIFWTNGSYERPNTVPNIDDFQLHTDILVDWNEQKTIGAVILAGDWNYAYCEDQWYFLGRLKVADREGVWFYGLVKDWWMNFIEKEVSIKGFCTKTSNKELLLKNINYVEPVIENPCRQMRINLTDNISRHWWEEVEIKRPDLTPEELTTSVVLDRDWYIFLTDCKDTPVPDSQLPVIRDKNDYRYKKGVVIVGELGTTEEVSHWKSKVLEKINYLLNNLSAYSLSKVSEEGLGTRSVAKNHYVLTPTHGAIGLFEETARVNQIDLSYLKDIVPISGINLDETSRLAPFIGKDLSESTLASKHASLIDSAVQRDNKKYRVLQRKVYLPYLRRSWGIKDDYLFRGNLSAEDTTNMRAQDSSLVSEYAEDEALVPIYQGNFAQGIKSKSKPTSNIWLPYINQLDTTFNWYISNSTTTQGQGTLHNKIPFLNEEFPPQFGFLLFDFVRERTDWTWFHYKGKSFNHLPVLIGLTTGWDKPEFATYDRDVKSWVKRVSKWWTNFELINSLYPLGWIYYYSALRNNTLKISYHDWDLWGSISGWFGVKNGQEGTIDFSSYDTNAYLRRNIENNSLTIDDYDKGRKYLINKYGILDTVQWPIQIQNGDIFFTDLTAFWEEYERAPSDYQYATETGWYLDVKKNHRRLESSYKKNREKSKLVFYWNNTIKKYQIGIYHTYEITHKLSDKETNDIIGIKFKDDNGGTARDIKSYEDTITTKTVKYHHISQVRNVETKKKNPAKRFNRVNFKKWGTTDGGKRILDNLDYHLKEIHRQYSYYSSWGEPFKPAYKEFLGVTNSDMLFALPKGPDGNYDLDTIYDYLNVKDYQLRRGVYRSDTIAMDEVGTTGRVFLGILSFGASEGGFAQSKWDRQRLDSLIFGGNKFIAEWSRIGDVPKIYDIIVNQIRNLFEEPKDWLGDVYTFDTANDFVRALNSADLQRDIYSALGLLDGEGRWASELETIKDKFFELSGTGYWLWIDNEEIPHLIFRPEAVKNDIELNESKVFRIPDSELPRQDYIDAINQRTSVQVSIANFPIDERIIFNEYSNPTEELNAENDFRLYVDRYAIADKNNPNDYYIVKYQGGRQLLDVRLAIPKRTLAKSKASDIWERTKVAFDLEKWREDFKIRQSIMRIEREREVAHEDFAQQRIRLESVSAGMGLATGLVGGALGGADFYASLQGLAHSDYQRAYTRANAKKGQVHLDNIGKHQRWMQKFDMTKTGISNLSNLATNLTGSAVQLAGLGIQSAELQADIKASLGLYTNKVNQMSNEHMFNERQFAMKLMELGNVYQQGEVNDRDINDSYNESKGLNEVHLEYRVPSDIQREGLERYYQLYGSNCQIPDVTFTFSKYMNVGDIYQFGFVDEVTNLWALEDKEALKVILANGFKIVSLRKVAKPAVLIPPKTWATRADEILKEASPIERDALFNKLTTQLDQIAIIKHLAANVPNKNDLVETVLPYLDKVSLVAKLSSSDNKEELTDYVLKLLNRIDEDILFNELLSRKDKERLIEQWIDDGVQALRVLWDKYPDKVIDIEKHNTKVAEKEKIIGEFKQELTDTYLAHLDTQSKLGSTNEELSSAKNTIGEQNKTISSQKTKISSLEGDIAKQKQTIKDKDDEIASEKGKVTRALGKVKELEGNIKTWEGKEKDWEEEKKNQNEKISALELQIKELEERPSGLIDAHSNVDYLITKKDDKVVITAWNKQKNIWQEQPDLLVKRRDETKLLRIANKVEKFETSQYPLWSYYRNTHGSKYNITVSTFSTLQGYVVGNNAKNLHAWVGRYSVEIDTNAPYIDKDGNWVKPYWYHSTKGWFDYDIGEGARRINSYEEYLELSKNALTDLQKELEEKDKTIEALRKIEQAKEQSLPNRWTAKLLGWFTYYALDYVFDRDDLRYSIVRFYIFSPNALVFRMYKRSSYEAKEIYGYKSQLFWAIRFTEFPWHTVMTRGVWRKVSHTNYTSSGVYSKDRFYYETAIKFNGDSLQCLSSFKYFPKVNAFTIDNTNYKNLDLENTLWISIDGNVNLSSSSPSDTKISTYLEYLDFLGLKWDEEKQKAVPKSLLN